jgi:toxin ParE1/3/4
VKPVEFHPEAEAEFTKDLDFYREQASGLAAEFATAVEQATTFLRHHPEAGTPVRHGLRRWRVRRFPYSLIYREEAERLYVLTLARHRRRPEYWHDRL